MRDMHTCRRRRVGFYVSVHTLKTLLIKSEITKLVPTKIDVIKKDSDQVGIRNPNAGKIRKLSDMAARNVTALFVASSTTDALMDCITPPSP